MYTEDLFSFTLFKKKIADSDLVGSAYSNVIKMEPFANMDST